MTPRLLGCGQYGIINCNTIIVHYTLNNVNTFFEFFPKNKHISVNNAKKDSFHANIQEKSLHKIVIFSAFFLF